MKKKIMFMLLAFFGAFAIQSCDDNDDPKTVSEAFVEALKQKYPDAKNVKWETKSQYMVAEFDHNFQETDVWFDRDANWCMAPTDYGKNLFLVPGVVGDAFANGKYGTWTLDDIDFYERQDIEFYVFEVEKKGETDMDIYYATDGTLIKAIPHSEADIYPTTPIR